MKRTSFKPTPEQRAKVKALACIDIPEQSIAIVLGLRSVKTLLKHFSKELAFGRAMAIAKVSQVALDMATSHKFPEVTLHWYERVGRSLSNISCNRSKSASPMKIVGKSKTPPADGKQHRPDKDGY